jgi:hypothetical protein
LDLATERPSLSLAGAQLITENTNLIAKDLDLLLNFGEIGCGSPEVLFSRRWKFNDLLGALRAQSIQVSGGSWCCMYRAMIRSTSRAAAMITQLLSCISFGT